MCIVMVGHLVATVTAVLGIVSRITSKSDNKGVCGCEGEKTDDAKAIRDF